MGLYNRRRDHLDTNTQRECWLTRQLKSKMNWRTCRLKYQTYFNVWNGIRAKHGNLSKIVISVKPPPGLVNPTEGFFFKILSRWLAWQLCFSCGDIIKDPSLGILTTTFCKCKIFKYRRLNLKRPIKLYSGNEQHSRASFGGGGGGEWVDDWSWIERVQGEGAKRMKWLWLRWDERESQWNW